MYLIIGGTGSFGMRYAAALDGRGEKVRIFSRDEFKQHTMRKHLDVDYVVGDVRDPAAVETAMRGVTHVVHAAALKHVRTGEEFPQEVVKTNILGTENVVNAARAAGVKHLVFLSTDKACKPVNTYGATKMVAERIVVAAGYNAVRYGNVIGSRGSVLHIFGEQAKDGAFHITDKRMSRFAVTFGYAIYLVDVAFGRAGGEIVVGKPPSVRIVDLAIAFNPDAEIYETGIKAGEKLHEELLTEYEAARVEDVGDYFVLRQDQGGRLPEELYPFSSDGGYLELGEIQELISANV